jgi:mRNA interferase MazF
VIRKFNNHLFLGVPLTTQIKENKYYHQLIIKGKTQCAMISQLKILENKRMRSKLAELSNDQFKKIRKKLSDMILGE